MSSEICVPVRTELFLELAELLRERKDHRDPVEVITTVLREWLATEKAAARPDPALLHQQSQGYFWKEVFLPHGTELRMSHKRKSIRAHIAGDDFIYGGQPSSPNQMVTLVKGTNRSSWDQLYVKRPGDVEWTLAINLRSMLDEVVA